MRILKAGTLSCAVLFSVIAGGAANAATIQNFDSGWYTNTGFTAGVTNINVGSSNLSGAVYHNWLAFDVTGLANQNVTAATLTFYGGNGTNTSATSETLGLFDYAGSINALIGNSQNNVGIYNDLGNGDSYGTAVVPGNGPIQQFTVTLSQAAIADLNAAAHNQGDTRFVIGGSLLSISAPFANEQLFAIFGPGAARAPAAFLNLETSVAAVPEPSTWAMMILGFAGVGFMAYRRKQTGPKLRLA
ncbi:MAG: PEPxxWA-CTERM sorting domain-containing protein [Bradyrhizobium sp.]|nr:PEPxxWA-CTERM sorting domain-containing protein [Bradyrhizobium sp.]